MADNFAACLTFVLQAEGGWSHNPRDAGGCTMLGVTLATYRTWKCDATLNCAELRLITSKEINQLYDEVFWQPVAGRDLPLGVDLMVMDAAVNMGASQSVKLLQRQVAADDDGVMGPVTLAATLAAEPAELIDSLALTQITFYRGLDNYLLFGNGWLNRVHARQRAAQAMVRVS